MRVAVIAVLWSASFARLEAQAVFPSSYIDSVLVEQARKAHIDYPREYAAAMRGDSAAIHALFRAGHSTDGVGADRHSTVLSELLKRLGDARFASALRSEPASTVRVVRCALDYASETSWSVDNPLTAALAPPDSNCVGGHSPEALGADGRSTS